MAVQDLDYPHASGNACWPTGRCFNSIEETPRRLEPERIPGVQDNTENFAAARPAASSYLLGSESGCWSDSMGRRALKSLGSLIREILKNIRGESDECSPTELKSCMS